MNAPERDGPAVADDSAENSEENIALDTVASGFNRELRRLLLLLAIALLAFGLLYFTPAGAIVRDLRHLRSHLAGNEFLAEATYAAIVAGLVALGVPRLTFYVVGGLAFGFWQGLLLAQFGTLAGSWLTFWAVRHGGRGWLERRFGDHHLVGRAFRVRSSIKAVALIRQLPLTGIMITGGLALSEVSTRVFLIGTFIGCLPQGIIAALIGGGLVDEKAMDGFGKLLTAGVVLLIGAFWLWRRRKRSSAQLQTPPREP